MNTGSLMIQLHVTKKLLAKLPDSKSGNLSVQSGENPLSGWHANLIMIQRRNCIVMVHDATRFPLFMPCLTKPDFANLETWFADTFMNTLLKCGANDQQMITASNLLAKLYIDSICDRSVQGTMNQLKGDIEHFILYNDIKVADLSGPSTGARMADRPCTVKGRKDCIWPDKTMLELLDEIA